MAFRVVVAAVAWLELATADVLACDVSAVDPFPQEDRAEAKTLSASRQPVMLRNLRVRGRGVFLYMPFILLKKIEGDELPLLPQMRLLLTG